MSYGRMPANKAHKIYLAQGQYNRWHLSTCLCMKVPIGLWNTVLKARITQNLIESFVSSQILYIWVRDAINYLLSSHSRYKDCNILSAHIFLCAY